MGWFDIHQGGKVSRVHNYLSWTAHAWIYDLLFCSGSSLTLKQGFGGPQKRSAPYRPNPNDEAHSFDLSPEYGISDVIEGGGDNNPNEGGGEDDTMRGHSEYERKTPSFVITKDGVGVLVMGDWLVWENQLVYGSYGAFQTVVGGKTVDIHPNPWIKRTFCEVDLGFPWQTPRIGNGTTIRLPLEASYPVNTVFVLMEKGEGEALERRLLAVSNVGKPTWWRPEGLLVTRYGTRVDGAATEFLYRAMKTVFGGEAFPYSNLRAVLLDHVPTPKEAYDPLQIILEEKELETWTVQDYVPEDPESSDPERVLPYVKSQTVPEWTYEAEDSNAEDLSVKAIAVIGSNSITGHDEFLFWDELGLEVAPGDIISREIRFCFRELDRG